MVQNQDSLCLHMSYTILYKMMSYKIYSFLLVKQPSSSDLNSYNFSLPSFFSLFSFLFWLLQQSLIPKIPVTNYNVRRFLSLYQQANLRYQLGVQQFNTILKPSTQRQAQIQQVNYSYLQDCPPPIKTPGYHLCF